MLIAARDEDGEQMDDRELRDQLMTLLVAGHETTATALAWAFDQLFRNPDAYQRLREEVDEGEHRVPRRGDRGEPADPPGGAVHRPRAEASR